MRSYYIALVVFLFGAAFIVQTISYRSSEASRRLLVERVADLTEEIEISRLQSAEVHSLDLRYSRELLDAKKTIADLKSDVANGKRRLYYYVEREKNDPPTTGVGNGAGSGLTNAAQSAYWELRERIELSNKQITALQAYIKVLQNDYK